MSNAVVDRIDTPSISSNSLSQKILIIDDEAGIRESLETLLMLEGFRIDLAADGNAGLDLLTRNTYDLLLLDLALPGESGIDLLPRIKSLVPDLPVIMITAYGTVGNVVDAIRAGASNFVQKPWDNEKLLADIRSAIARHKAEAEVIQLKRVLKQRYNFENIIGKSEPMLRLFDTVAQVAPSRSTRTPRAATSPSSRSTPAPSRRTCSNPASSATSREPSPVPSWPRKACLKRPTAARSSSTRSGP
jgi:FixJ family two-component response regulator